MSGVVLLSVWLENQLAPLTSGLVAGLTCGLSGDTGKVGSRSCASRKTGSTVEAVPPSVPERGTSYGTEKIESASANLAQEAGKGSPYETVMSWSFCGGRVLSWRYIVTRSPAAP